MLETISETRYLNWALAYSWLGSIEPTLNSELDAGRANGISALVKASARVVPALIDKTIAALESIE